MATTVYTPEEIQLQDGTEVVLKPLNIKGVKVFQGQLREYNNYLDSVRNEEAEPDEEKTIDMFKEMTKTCLRSQAPDLVADDDAFEEALDIETIFKILDVCAGIKFNDPNLQAAASLSLMSQ